MASPKFKPGDIVKCTTTGERAFVDYYQAQNDGTFTYVLNPVDGGAAWWAQEHNLIPDVTILPSGYGPIVSGNNKSMEDIIRDYYRDIEPPKTIKCECGVDSVGAGLHSPWCPKANN